MACSPLYFICHVHHNAQKTKIKKLWNAQTNDKYEKMQEMLTFFEFDLATSGQLFSTETWPSVQKQSGINNMLSIIYNEK